MEGISVTTAYLYYSLGISVTNAYLCYRLQSFLLQLPRHRPGIVGIERSIEQRNKETNKNISLAFEDLNKLMEKVEICHGVM